ncbi:MAG TPA: hypothetical protein VN894_05150 [Polyangiaceae bacterium]|nr:hypothetical protein [Polyangiaceae bacterium]
MGGTCANAFEATASAAVTPSPAAVNAGRRGQDMERAVLLEHLPCHGPSALTEQAAR